MRLAHSHPLQFLLLLVRFPVPNTCGIFVSRPLQNTMIVFIFVTLTHHYSSFQVVFSLGADDVFVMVDKWKNARTNMPCASTTEVAIISLPR